MVLCPKRSKYLSEAKVVIPKMVGNVGAILYGCPVAQVKYRAARWGGYACLV